MNDLLRSPVRSFWDKQVEFFHKIRAALLTAALAKIDKPEYLDLTRVERKLCTIQGKADFIEAFLLDKKQLLLEIKITYPEWEEVKFIYQSEVLSTEEMKAIEDRIRRPPKGTHPKAGLLEFFDD